MGVGDNSQCQLGQGSCGGAQVSPVPIGTSLVSARGGQNFACGAQASGILFCWGRNDQGQVGNASASATVAAPAALTFPASTLAYAVGASHACAALQTHALYCWGRNSEGQLGNGSFTTRNTPGAVSSSKAFVDVSAGTDHTCALTLGSGQAYCWGANDAGQANPFSAGSVRVITPAQQPGSGWTRVAAGQSMSCLGSGSELVCWGDNANGQLGVGSADAVVVFPSAALPQAVASVSSAYGTTCAATPAGSVLCWGAGVSGQMGDGGSLPSNLSPVQVPGIASQVVSVGGGSVCALHSSFAIFCWGSNSVGQLGLGYAGGASATPVPTGSGSYVNASPTNRYHV